MPRRFDRVTMKDVAERAGVTARTVSNVVNNYQFVKDETRKRVWDAVNELGYTMNVSARGLKQGNTGLIALAIPDLTMPYFAELADAVISYAKRLGINVLIEPTASNRQQETEVLHQVRWQFADGIIYCPLGIGSAQLSSIDIGIPMVILSDPIGTAKYDYVMIRNREAAEVATDCLISGGARRIAAIGLGAGQEEGPAQQRYLGYRDSLIKHDIMPDGKLEVRTKSWHRGDGLSAIGKLYEDNIDFDAVFAFTDQIAAGALYALQLHGARVPDDVAVIGFDNNEESQYLFPPLTTIDPGVDEVAQEAVNRLAKLIEEKDVAERETIKVGFRLVTRQSTKALPDIAMS